MGLSGHSRVRALVVGGALAAALALPLGVYADTTPGATIAPAYSRGATIHVDHVTVDSKLIATVDISFTCDPMTFYDWETGQDVTTTEGLADSAATIVQLSGRSINSATGWVYGGAVVCDGSTVSIVSIPVVAVDLPWKNGSAAVGATVSIVDPDFHASDYASSGPISIKLTK